MGVKPGFFGVYVAPETVTSQAGADVIRSRESKARIAVAHARPARRVQQAEREGMKCRVRTARESRRLRARDTFDTPPLETAADRCTGRVDPECIETAFSICGQSAL